MSTIPEHVLVLGGFGVVLGLAGSLLYRRLDWNLVVLIPVLVVLLDLDHLPIALGVAQPIRPVHSLIFLALVVIATALVVQRPDTVAAVVCGFFAHLSVDTGLFPAFSPISFDYYDLADYKPLIVAAAVISALIAGYMGKRRSQTES